MSAPWKIRVDWLLNKHYGDKVVVELHRMDWDEADQGPMTLRRFNTIPEAIDYAVQFFKGRGLGFWCNVDLHQRNDDTHITMHPQPLKFGRTLRPVSPEESPG